MDRSSNGRVHPYLTRVQIPEKGRVWRANPGAGPFETRTTSLGSPFDPVVQVSAEVLGVPTELVPHFSQRRHGIEAAAVEAGTSSAQAVQIALRTCRSKDYGVEPDDLRQGGVAGRL